ncbi:AAA family ATPase [Verrucosispora sp. TAA-831]|uniref:AAA family ATPase n=1 Tax=Verrucosispora sp. TAA-831 TaxID=3422227 RepID=UPI003D6F56CD
MHRSSFVGRTGELKHLRSVVAGVGGRGVILSGGAGVGKSRLVREAVAQLPASRYVVWPITAAHPSTALPFGGLAQVLPVAQPAGLTPAGVLRWVVDSLHEQAMGRSIVLTVDDAHLLDPPSSALVQVLARQEDVVLLGTVHDGEQMPLPLRPLCVDELVERVELTPFGRDETAELLTAVLGGPVEARSIDRMLRLSAGNPLLLHELLHGTMGSGEWACCDDGWQWNGHSTRPLDVTDVIGTRIEHLTPGVRKVVELVALSEQLGLRLLTTATDTADVRQAEENGLIAVVRHDRRVDVQLTHPLYGELLRRRCPPARTRQLQTELADLVQATGARRPGDLLRVALWRLGAGSGQDPRLLLAGAMQAFARYDVPLTVQLARAALDAGGGHDAAELLATILMLCERPHEALQVLDQVRDEPADERRRSRWLTVRGMVTYWSLGDESTADTLAEAAVPMTDPGHQARVWAFEALMRMHRMEIAAALRLSQAVLTQPAAGPGARGLTRCVVAYVDATRGLFRRNADTIAQVEAEVAGWRGDVPYLQAMVESARAARLALTCDLAGIDAIAADEFADLVSSGGLRLGSGFLTVLQSYAARLRGRTDQAITFSDTAGAILATSRLYGSLAHGERAQVAAWRGDPDAALAAMAAADASYSPCLAVFYPWLELARGGAIAATGDLSAAVGHLVALTDRLRRDGLAGYEGLALHDLVRLGRAATPIGPTCADGAQRSVAQRLSELAERTDGTLSPLLARHARACAAEDGAGLLAVADAFAAAQLTVWAAEAAATAVRVLRRDGDPLAADARRRLGTLLAACDRIRTPTLDASRDS